MINSEWDIYLMASIYLFAGITHFVFPQPYLKVMPNYLPYPKTLVYASGLVEILLAIALMLPSYRSAGAIGVIILLFAVLPVHIEQLRNKDARLGLALWVVLLRQPLQVLLIWWAFQYVSI